MPFRTMFNPSRRGCTLETTLNRPRQHRVEAGWSTLIIAIAALSVCPTRTLAADAPCTLAAIRKIAPRGMTLGSGGAIDPPEPKLQTATGVRLIPANALGDGAPAFCFVTGLGRYPVEAPSYDAFCRSIAFPRDLERQVPVPGLRH